MIGGHDRNVRTDGDIVSDEDAGVIHDRQVEVGKEVFADEQVTAVVDLHRPLKVAGFTDAAEDIADQLLPIGIVFVHLIKLAARLMRLVLEVFELLLARIEHLAGKDFFFFCHEKAPP